MSSNDLETRVAILEAQLEATQLVTAGFLQAVVEANGDRRALDDKITKILRNNPIKEEWTDRTNDAISRFAETVSGAIDGRDVI